MNKAEPFGQSGAAIVLADRPSFTIGNTRVEPAMRSIIGVEPVTVEPRVMQVLVALFEADGRVLSRDRLIDLCWSGVIVGDDAINRAIAELRRAATRAKADFEVETISKVGYRLKADGDYSSPATADSPMRPGRRAIVGGIAAVALAGSAAYYWMRPPASSPEVNRLVERAKTALRAEAPDSTQLSIKLLEQAVQIAPGEAGIWGLLAIALRNAAEFSASDNVAALISKTDEAAKRALALDPREGNALTALATIQPYMGNWIAYENRLLEILEIAPGTAAAISHITHLYQSAGLLKRSKLYNDRALKIDPLSPIFQFRDAIKHWILGDVARADLTIDRILQIWPRHPGVWNARMMLYAYTGRATAGLALLDNAEIGPRNLKPLVTGLWRTSLQAIDAPTPAKIDKVVKDTHAAILQMPDRAANGMMTLSTLGRVDDAFNIARGYFLGQGGQPVLTHNTGGQSGVLDLIWKRSMMLFTPATLAMRRDPQFAKLCKDMGLVAFWNQAGRAPDYAEFDRIPRR